MIPWGKIPVTLQLGRWTCEEDIHIYPGAIISWKAAKVLSRHPVAEPQRTDLLAEYDEDSVMEPSIAEICAITNKEDSNIKL